MVDNLRKKSIASFGWKIAQSICTLGSSFVIQIILARILLPEDFGIVAITTVFMTFANTIIETSFSSSIIQKSNLDQRLISSVFYANIVLSIVVYGIIYFTSPLISMFYDNEILSIILRVQGLRVLVSALYSTQSALLTRNMEFKKLFISYLIGAFAQGVSGIYMAYAGYGVWAIVLSTVINYAVAGIFILILAKWRPMLFFSFSLVKSSLSFSSKILVVSLVKKLFYNIRSLVMGKVYSSEILGYFNKGFQFPSTAMTIVDGSFTAVAFTSLSKLQDDKKRLLEVLRLYIQTMTYFTTPMMIGMFIVAKPMVIVLLTDKWLASVPFLQIICLMQLFLPLSVKTNAFDAIGRSDLSMKLHVSGLAISILLLFATMSFNAHIMVMSGVVSNLILHIFIAITAKKTLAYDFKDQISDFISPFISTTVMVAVIYGISLLPLRPFFTLIIEICAGILVYILWSILFKNKVFYNVKSIFLNKLFKKEV